MTIRGTDSIGPAPSWLETDLADLDPPLVFTRRVIGVEAVTGEGTITCVNGEGESGQVLTLSEGGSANVEITSITAASGITLLRVYFARFNGPGGV